MSRKNGIRETTKQLEAEYNSFAAYGSVSRIVFPFSLGWKGSKTVVEIVQRNGNSRSFLRSLFQEKLLPAYPTGLYRF